MAAESWLVLCDFDGTISQTDVIDSLLQAHGQDGWQQLESDWLAGRIGSRQCMQQQVRLLDLNLEALHQHLNNIAIDPHFGGFLAQAAQLGYPVGVVSDGIDYAIHHILSRNQISGLSVAANQLEPTHHPDRWQLSSPHEAVGCASGTCKCACIAQARSAVADRVLLVGDGRSDFCAAHRADHVFAKGRLRDYCAAEGLPHTPIHDFEEAARLLPELQRRSA